MEEKIDECDNENRCKVSLHNSIQEVKKDWKQFDDALKYAKVYKKIMITGSPPTQEESYILESTNNEIPPSLRKPFHMVIVDHCQGTDMYSLARRDFMNHVTIKHIQIPILFATWCSLGVVYPQ